MSADADNPARPRAGDDLAALADVPEGGAIVRDFRSGDALFSLILARQGDAVRGYVNLCPHARFPLERFDGRLIVQDKRYIVCAAHFASFHIEDGRCAGGPGKMSDRLEAFPVHVDGERIRAGARSALSSGLSSGA